MSKIKRVLIVGGTHGNELIGIYLIKKFEQSPVLVQRSSFESCTLFANPKAHALMKRYLDEDLNRCFQRQKLANPHLNSYEAQRAKEINQMFGASGSKPADFVIDLHSTTANMGLTLILAGLHSFNLELAAYLTTIHPAVKVLYSVAKHQDNPYLDSISPFGCTVEVGAVAQGVLDAVLFQQTEALVYEILNYIEAHNQNILLPVPQMITLYQSIEILDYPRNQHQEIQAMIHPQLQSRDYQALHPGNPVFLTFAGETIYYQGDSTVYPVFINEAAYYEKGVAMHITQAVQIDRQSFLSNYTGD